MPELVALAVPPGPAFLDALRRIWDDGDAVLPLDPHAPAHVAASQAGKRAWFNAAAAAKAPTTPRSR